MEEAGHVLESPASPDEILFIEDRRPGNVSPVPDNSKLNRSTNENCKIVSEDFIKLSSDVVDQHVGTTLKSDEIHDKLQTEMNDYENKNTVQLEDDLCFVIEDRNPNLTGEDTQSPKYKINENYLKLHAPKDVVKKNRFANPCFNCGETEHIIRDCPHPKDYRKITRSRKEFMDSKPNMPVYRRYHKDGESYGQGIPGEISPELRNALGLEDKELPSYTYMMRLAGYPPGWLQEAVVSYSGISMFDGQGKEVQQPGTEQGENTMCQDKYDIGKIIHYPGFNVPPPPGTYDDCDYWRCPPFSKRQSVEAMVERLANRVVGGYKRKKLSLNATTAMDDSLKSVESHDMEYEETPENVELPEDHCKFVPPLPDQDLPPPPPLESPESPPPILESPDSPDPDPSLTDTESQSLLSNSAEETSLLELVEQKKLLLAQLNDVSPVCGTPDSKIGKTKTVEFGTPILKSVSPFARLPSSDKFSVNICDVINFENLPDSTGKYEQMSGIIKRVRNTLKQFSE